MTCRPPVPRLRAGARITTDRSTPPPPAVRCPRVWENPLLWTLQGWLAMFYLAAGYAKLAEPRESLITLMSWPAWVEDGTLVGVGGAEIILALGVVSPVLSWSLCRPLLRLSAGALMLLALAMGGLHSVLGDWGLAAVNAALAAMAAAILWGRRPRDTPLQRAMVPVSRGRR